LPGSACNSLWSVSSRFSRGLESRTEHELMMDHADTPLQGDLDGRGNLSRRLRTLVERCETLKPETAKLLEEALIRGELKRGDASRITGWPKRTARSVLNGAVAAGFSFRRPRRD
jgi:Fic family protein